MDNRQTEDLSDLSDEFFECLDNADLAELTRCSAVSSDQSCDVPTTSELPDPRDGSLYRGSSGATGSLPLEEGGDGSVITISDDDNDDDDDGGGDDDSCDDDDDGDDDGGGGDDDSCDDDDDDDDGGGDGESLQIRSTHSSISANDKYAPHPQHTGKKFTFKKIDSLVLPESISVPGTEATAPASGLMMRPSVGQSGFTRAESSITARVNSPSGMLCRANVPPTRLRSLVDTGRSNRSFSEYRSAKCDDSESGSDCSDDRLDPLSDCSDVSDLCVSRSDHDQNSPSAQQPPSAACEDLDDSELVTAGQQRRKILARLLSSDSDSSQDERHHPPSGNSRQNGAKIEDAGIFDDDAHLCTIGNINGSDANTPENLESRGKIAIGEISSCGSSEEFAKTNLSRIVDESDDSSFCSPVIADRRRPVGLTPSVHKSSKTTGTADSGVTHSPVRPATSPVRPATSPVCSSEVRSAGRGGDQQQPPAGGPRRITPEAYKLSRLPRRELEERMQQKQLVYNSSNVSALPDQGARLRQAIADLEAALRISSSSRPVLHQPLPPADREEMKPRSAADDQENDCSRRLDLDNDHYDDGDRSPDRQSSEPRSPRDRAAPSDQCDTSSSADDRTVSAEVRRLANLSPDELKRCLAQKQLVYNSSNVSALPDGGARLRQAIADLESALRISKSRHDQHESQPDVADRQSLENRLKELRTRFSTASLTSQAGTVSDYQREIVELEKQLMLLSMAGGGDVTGHDPVAARAGLFSRHVPLNRTAETCGGRGGDRLTAKYIAEPAADDYECKLLSGQSTTTFVTDCQRRLESEARQLLRDSGAIPEHIMTALYAANPEINKLYGGRMTQERRREASNITVDALERLHASLRSLPSADQLTSAPQCLSVSLMHHQAYALTWMAWRERQLPPAGVLADDMGLGKTLTVVAHALRCAERRRQARALRKEDGVEDEELTQWKSKAASLKAREGVVLSRGTLVVCPASVLNQWRGEVEKRTVEGSGVTVMVYHGTARDINVKRLARHDFVLTTYGIVQRELSAENDDDLGDGVVGNNSGKALARVCWERVVLDEAHHVRNAATRTARAVCRVRAGFRWAVTGTPVHNRREDVYSMLRFLRVTPFNEKVVWKRWIDKSAQGEERLSLLIRALVLRRTKSDISPITGKTLVSLPKREVQLHLVTLTEGEKAVYDKVFEYSKSALEEFIKLREQRENERNFLTDSDVFSQLNKGSGRHAVGNGRSEGGRREEVKQHHILVQLLRLRQICCHPALAKTMLDSSARREAGLAGDSDDDIAGALGKHLGTLSLAHHRNNDNSGADQEDCQDDEALLQDTILSSNNPVFQEEFCSAKLKLLLDHLVRITRELREKVIVVSQWTSMLAIIGRHLRQAGVRYCTIAGDVPVAQRATIVDQFNSNRHSPPVMLLSIGAGGVGLNLVGANHLFIYDPHWNPQMEQQAGDRIYRVGQTKPVFMHRLVCSESMEQRVMQLQENKLQLASSLLSGDTAAGNSRLTLSDLKMLFDLK